MPALFSAVTLEGAYVQLPQEKENESNESIHIWLCGCLSLLRSNWLDGRTASYRHVFTIVSSSSYHACLSNNVCASVESAYWKKKIYRIVKSDSWLFLCPWTQKRGNGCNQVHSTPYPLQISSKNRYLGFSTSPPKVERSDLVERAIFFVWVERKTVCRPFENEVI